MSCLIEADPVGVAMRTAAERWSMDQPTYWWKHLGLWSKLLKRSSFTSMAQVDFCWKMSHSPYHLVGFLWQHGNCHFNPPSELEFKVARRQNSERVEMFIVMLILFPVYLFLIQFCFPDLSSPLYFSFRQTPCLCILNKTGIAAAEEAQPRISRTNEAHCTSLPVSTSSQYFCRPAISTKTFAKFGSSGNFAEDLGFGWVGLWCSRWVWNPSVAEKANFWGLAKPRWVDRGAGGAATSPHLGDHRRRDAKISQAVWVFGTAFYSISLLFLREKCDCFNAWDLQVISLHSVLLL